jgi:hypothetical protein
MGLIAGWTSQGLLISGPMFRLRFAGKKSRNSIRDACPPNRDGFGEKTVHYNAQVFSKTANILKNVHTVAVLEAYADQKPVI